MEKEEARTDEPAVQCHHLFHHCTTWAEREAIQERIDHSREIGDMAAVPLLLMNLEWCPNLPEVPAKPEQEGK